MFPTSWVTRGRVALEGTETEQKFANLLFDETVQVLSSFQLNQIASLTYGELVCDQIFEILETVMANPAGNSPLCLQKSLVVSKHCLVYGSEKCVNSVWALARYVHELQEFNTVLLAQKRAASESLWLQIKGGGVDKGLPVREAAKELNSLIQSKEQIRVLRHTSADPNSLVPVGDTKAAFVSDEVRHYMLQKRMKEQLGMITKSNLAKADASFGGGYQSKDGKTVVGAAHSVEEMIAAAEREKKRYSDDGPPAGYHPPGPDSGGQAATLDLLGFGENPQQVSAQTISQIDLLDLSAEPELTSKNPGAATTMGNEINAAGDLLSLGAMSSSTPDAKMPSSKDLLEIPNTMHSSFLASAEKTDNDLLDMRAVAPATQKNEGLKDAHPKSTKISAEISPIVSIGGKKPVMGSGSSKLSAFDDLSHPDAKTRNTGLSADDALKRILNNGSGSGGMSDIADPPLSQVALETNISFHVPSTNVHEPSQEAPPLIAPGTTLKVGATYGGTQSSFQEENEDNSGFGFVMGGNAGTGLQPTAPPPTMPPPPPPGCAFP